MEFTIERNPRDIAEEILKKKPKLVGFGIYIWNTKQTLEVIACIKKIASEVTLVLGGPEVSYESESQEICKLAHYVIKGEADFLFHDLAEKILVKNEFPEAKFMSGILPDISTIQSPYSYYTDNDIQNRIMYVEASRGCPYKCEYCLSSLDKSVRNFPLESFLKDLGTLIERGARQFKFIDRTFNLSPAISGAILQFFLDRIHLGLFLHFEMVPDRLPLELKNLIAKFPAGALQFEIGIQTWNPEVAKLVSRRTETLSLMKSLAKNSAQSSFFAWYLEFSDFLSAKYPQSHSIALLNLFKATLEYLTTHQNVENSVALQVLAKDYSQNGRRELPHFLRTTAVKSIQKSSNAPSSNSVPQRQRNHLISNQEN